MSILLFDIVQMTMHRTNNDLDRSTLVALFAALGMFSALAIALLCYVIWDLLVSSSPQTERSVQEEVQSPQTVLAGILTSNLFGNGMPPPPNGRPIPSKNVRR
ncbi:hypothetical protein GPALN_003130 [Globodera pallida]|nr:hypothetical protein GPALN_003130 [Globodera pallida]